MSANNDTSIIPARYVDISYLRGDVLENLKKFDNDQVIKFVIFPPAMQKRPPYSLPSEPSQLDIDTVNRHGMYKGNVSGIGLYFVPNVRVRGSGYMVKDGMRIYGPDLIPDYVEKAIEDGNFEEIHNGTQRREVHVKDAALICNQGYLIYGHWLVDILPKAWVFFSHYGKIPDDMVFPFCDDTPEYGLEMLSTLFGLRRDRVLIYNNRLDDLCIERLVAPSQMHNNHIFHPAAARALSFVRDKILEQEQPKRSEYPERIYVSRQKFRHKTISSRRFLDNEEELIEIANSEGFEVIHPEDLSWPEQVRTFASAKFIIGEAGSGMHNTLFSGSDAHVISICESQLQGTLAALLKQKITLIMQDHSYVKENTIHFHIDPAKFAKTINSIVKNYNL